MPNAQILKIIHYVLAFLWIYQGVVPKLIWTSQDEITMWQFAGLTVELATWLGKISGIIEIIFGLCFIFYPHKLLHYLNILGLLGLFIGVSIILPHTLIAAFNPVVMNLAMANLSVIALLLIKQQSETKTL